MRCFASSATRARVRLRARLTPAATQGIATMAMLVAVFTPVPAGDFVFVSAVAFYAAMATALRFPRQPRIEQPGPYPFRPIAAPPIRGFVDQHQASFAGPPAHARKQAWPLRCAFACCSRSRWLSLSRSSFSRR
jgi:hypothetical protein